MDIFMAHDLGHSAPYKKMQKNVLTHTMDKIKGFRPYGCQPLTNLHTAISVNKPKLSVTKHDQTDPSTH